MTQRRSPSVAAHMATILARHPDAVPITRTYRTRTQFAIARRSPLGEPVLLGRWCDSLAGAWRAAVLNLGFLSQPKRIDK